MERREKMEERRDKDKEKTKEEMKKVKKKKIGNGEERNEWMKR